MSLCRNVATSIVALLLVGNGGCMTCQSPVFRAGLDLPPQDRCECRGGRHCGCGDEQSNIANYQGDRAVVVNRSAATANGMRRLRREPSPERTAKRAVFHENSQPIQQVAHWEESTEAEPSGSASTKKPLKSIQEKGSATHGVSRKNRPQPIPPPIDHTTAEPPRAASPGQFRWGYFGVGDQ